MKSPTNAATANITAAFARAYGREEVIRGMIIAMLSSSQFLHEEDGLASIETRLVDSDGVHVPHSAPWGEMMPLLDVLGALLDEANKDDPEWGQGGG